MKTPRSVNTFASPLDALRWHIEMGADELIDHVPVDRYATAVKSTSPAPETIAASVRPTEMVTTMRQASGPALAPAEGARDAIDIAAGAVTVEDLFTRLKAFDGCALKFTATNTVFADGRPGANLMFVGEAPGVDEDRQGLPFVGVSGQLLDRMVMALGYARSSVYITNILFWRPPGNRSPTAAETAACLPFVRRHVELVRPKLLVLLGGSAAKNMLDRSEGIMRLRGKWFDYVSDGLDVSIPAMPTFHPAFLLRQPAQKREAWRDFLAIQERLEGLD